MFSGGTRQSLTVPVTDLTGVNNVGFNAEIDAASVNAPGPEPVSLALLGPGVVGTANLVRRRSSTSSRIIATVKGDRSACPRRRGWDFVTTMPSVQQRVQGR